MLTDIKYILGHNPLFPAFRLKQPEQALEITDRALNFLNVDEGVYQIGYNGKAFCFDNELGVHKVFLHAFEFADRLVTNVEYAEFIQDGGYRSHQLWLADGWDWVNQNEISKPLYWHKIDNEWHEYTLYGLKTLEPNQPVTHISFYEADAFAKWKSKRLLTEFEWEVAAMTYNGPQLEPNFLSSGSSLHPQPASECVQMAGDCWQWTNSAYLPYPYYKQAAGAVGEYNGKFMINQMVLRGGSCATPASHYRHTYRNFFQPDKRWQFTGIRLGGTR
jgi:ergothioneine biosynthesis protein EgtB